MHGAGGARVVIVGGGFAGLQAALALRRTACRVVLVDRSNHHTFQPLLYQVATAALAPSEVGYPIRRVFRHQRNLTVVLGEVASIDVDARRIRVVAAASEVRDDAPIDFDLDYDTLVLAAGAENAYFGHDDWAELAPSLKTLEDAVEIRGRILAAFERAEIDDDPVERRRRLTFVIVGAGPTGVELAGAIKELAVDAIARDFRRIDTSSARVVLVEGGPRVLGAMDSRLSASARRTLERMGVEVRVDAVVTRVDGRGVTIGGRSDDPASGERLEAANVIWAAGVKASGLGRMLAGSASIAPALDHAGRVRVTPDLRVPGHAEIFVAGDMACVPMDAAAGSKGPIVPGVAPAAMQMGRFVGKVIRAEIEGRPPPDRFRYVDKGSLATIGRSRAVAQIMGLRVRGFPAWALWSLVHVTYLIGFRNRIVTLLSWILSYLFFSKGSRLITQPWRRPVAPPSATSTTKP